MENVQIDKTNGSGKKAKKDEPARSTAAEKELLIEVECQQKSFLMMDAYEPTQMVRDLFRKERRVPRVDEALEVIAAEKIYRNAKGHPVVPVECLLACLREAGRTIKVGKEKISYAEKSAVYSIFTEITSPDADGESDLIPLIFPADADPLLTVPSHGGDKANDPRSPWRMDIRRGMMNNGGKKVANCLIRPRFNTWGFRLSVSVDLTAMESLTKEHIKLLFERAGNRVGLLSWRPDCNGPAGRFAITKWEVATG